MEEEEVEGLRFSDTVTTRIENYYATDPADEKWKQHANCVGIDPEFFFPKRAEQINPVVVRICGRCDVRQECLDYSLKYHMDGVWGGLPKYKRLEYRKKITSDRGDFTVQYSDSQDDTPEYPE